MSDEKNFESFCKRYKAFFQKMVAKIGKEACSELEHNLCSGFITQALSVPLDLFVEKWIYNHEWMRPSQFVSLHSMYTEFCNGIADTSRQGTFPSTMVSVNRVLTLILVIQYRELYGVDLSKNLQPTKQEEKLAKDLYEEFLAYTEDFHEGDEYELMAYYMQEMDLEYLFEIREE